LFFETTFNAAVSFCNQRQLADKTACSNMSERCYKALLNVSTCQAGFMKLSMSQGHKVLPSISTCRAGFIKLLMNQTYNALLYLSTAH